MTFEDGVKEGKLFLCVDDKSRPGLPILVFADSAEEAGRRYTQSLPRLITLPHPIGVERVLRLGNVIGGAELTEVMGTYHPLGEPAWEPATPVEGRQS